MKIVSITPATDNKHKYTVKLKDREDKLHHVHFGVKGYSDYTIHKDPDRKKEIIANYKETITSPFVAASRGYLDDIIKPQNTRWRICKSLKYLRTKILMKNKQLNQ